MHRMSPDRHQPTPPQFRWSHFLIGVIFPAIAATAGFVTIFQAALPRATGVLLMAWSLVLTYVASRQMTMALRNAAGAPQRQMGTSDE